MRCSWPSIPTHADRTRFSSRPWKPPIQTIIHLPRSKRWCPTPNRPLLKGNLADPEVAKVVEGRSQSGHWQQTESDGGLPIYFKALNLLTLLTYAESASARQGDQKEAVKRLCRDEETL